ncbi:SDR family NAD(P)-dependent oxidoreductase [Nonomuraea sp. NPDC003560]|uniref:SDR family NAD(P)-dependent oxidoreductase n=1 Tax=Nonomuraea sp. NPDC003560 TaxID=3364341 RepID=UPI003692ED3C
MHISLTDSGASPVAGKTVLITGGTSGIGAATARLLLGRGHRVAVTRRAPGRLKSFLDDAGHADRVLGPSNRPARLTQAGSVLTGEPGTRNPG